MRVIEPNKRHKRTPKHKDHHQRDSLVAAFAFIVIVGGLWFYGYQTLLKNNSATSQPEQNQTPTPAVIEQPKKNVLKTYTADEFRKLYETFAYPNTQKIDENTPITGNASADQQIKTLASSRGYIIRSAPVTDTFRAVAPDMQLQERASQPWLDMQASAKKEGQLLKLTAAYRSAVDQKQIFLERLQTQGAYVTGISTGQYDSQINKVLASTAPPGYSRHHNGYTIDIACDNDPYVAFEKSLCFAWLSGNNYKNAKLHGWIPSYPSGTIGQGPEPEAWEYVWVGKDTLTD